MLAPFAWTILISVGLIGPASARTGAEIDGASLGIAWALPFMGLLLSIAVLPLVTPRLWEHHLGKLSALWALAALTPLWLFHGAAPTLQALVHVLAVDFVPFILLLLALYVIAGGIVITGNLRGTPLLNTGLLAFGTVLASLIGTTGASMVMIRPLIRANDDRRRNVHIVVFFIFLVSNIGGALTPLGDPPLFLGFLRGVDFFWTARALWPQTLFATGLLLALFFLLDAFLFRKDRLAQPPDPTPKRPLRLRGLINIAMLGALIAVILGSGMWRPGVAFELAGVRLELQDLVRDLLVLLLALASFLLTPRRNRAANDFSWAPIAEVAKLFAGIFVCIIPVAAALQAGSTGVFAPLLKLVSKPDGTPNEAAYFWLTGLLSSVLDNAPTYLVFFDLAGGDAQTLMSRLSGTLAAISMGAVFMGANTYLGNAPNFMVYAIAKGAGVRMPGFFGYMAWSGLILLPLFGLVTLIFIG